MKRTIVLCSILLLLVPFTALAQVDYCEGNFDYDKDVDGTDAALFKTDFGRSGFKNPCPADGPAPVPKTGQTISNHAGDDGDLEKGVVSPNPRFTILYYYYDGSHSPNYVACNPPTVECKTTPDANLDMVLDNMTGLYWTRSACVGNCSPTIWATAFDDTISWFNDVSWCGQNDWRLPNVRELQSLVDYGQDLPALPTEHPFVNVQQTGYYWSSTTHDFGYHTNAWYVKMDYGSVSDGYKAYTGYVWPVRGGH